MAKKNIRTSIIAVAVALALAGCGGGGGGGSGGFSYVNNSSSSGNLGGNSSSGQTVPYYTPVRADVVRPVNNTVDYTYDNSGFFAKNLSGGTEQEVIMAGRMSPGSGTYSTYDMQIWGWKDGNLVNKTSQWFSGTDNRIVGTEPSVKFGDFDGDGKIDMYVAPNTDTNVWGPGAVFFNNGSSFTRSDLNFGTVNGHDSVVYDLNGDGYADIITQGMRFSFSDGAKRTFTTYTVTNYPGAGASVAAADFLQNGRSQIIITDMNTTGGDNNRLYSWNISGGNVVLTQEAVLPTPRFLLPKWASYNFAGTHDIRVLAFDFDNSGRSSAVIFSRPAVKDGNWPAYSEIQFNKNMGGGVFIDVTDTTLVGYNTSTPSNYNPQLVDVNSDGLTDIVLTASNWSDNQGPQVLIHTKEHKYVASYSTVLTAFLDQAQSMEKQINAAVENGANGVIFVRGPDNQMYLVTAVTFNDNGTSKKALYLSKVGTATTSAQATADAIKQTWPWMSDAQVNSVLASSGQTWWGLTMIDPVKAMSPVGALQIPLLDKMSSLIGSISGINLNGHANSIKAIDSLGRDFNVNYSVTSFSSVNAWSRNAEYMFGDTRSAQFNADSLNYYGNFQYTNSNDIRNTVVGITGMRLSPTTAMSMQYSRLPFNPFVNITGSWGTVISTGTMETTVAYREQGMVAKTGLMYTGTEIRSGLVRKINPITSVWAETGYEFDKFKSYIGMLPKVIDGSADLTLPTGIDNQGRITYSSIKADISSPTTQYLRFAYDERINRKLLFRLTGFQTTQNQRNIMAQIKYDF